MPVRKKTSKKRSGKKSGAKKKALAKKKAASKQKPSRAKKAGAARKTSQGVRRRESRYVASRMASPASVSQSGDLQGLSDIERADSESVDELLEEGNAFEAGVVEGVEDAGARSEREVHTREVPEDDVPDEYLDPDK